MLPFIFPSLHLLPFVRFPFAPFPPLYAGIFWTYNSHIPDFRRKASRSALGGSLEVLAGAGTQRTVNSVGAFCTLDRSPVEPCVTSSEYGLRILCLNHTKEGKTK